MYPPNAVRTGNQPTACSVVAIGIIKSKSFLLQNRHLSQIQDEGMSGIRWQHLTDHHPVKEHAQGRQALLYRGLRLGLQLQLDEGSDMDRFDLGEGP